MEIEILQENGAVMVNISGRVDTVTAPELENGVKQYFGQGVDMVFNCAKMEYISSSGLRVVLAAHKQVTAAGGKFMVTNLNAEVKSVFDLTGFSRIIALG